MLTSLLCHITTFFINSQSFGCNILNHKIFKFIFSRSIIGNLYLSFLFAKITLTNPIICISINFYCFINNGNFYVAIFTIFIYRNFCILGQFPYTITTLSSKSILAPYIQSNCCRVHEVVNTLGSSYIFNLRGLHLSFHINLFSSIKSKLYCSIQT